MAARDEKRTRLKYICCKCYTDWAPTEPQSVSRKHPVFESFWTKVDEDHDMNIEDKKWLNKNYIYDVEAKA